MLVTLPLQEMTLISRVPQRTAAVAQAVAMFISSEHMTPSRTLSISGTAALISSRNLANSSGNISPAVSHRVITVAPAEMAVRMARQRNSLSLRQASSAMNSTSPHFSRHWVISPEMVSRVFSGFLCQKYSIWVGLMGASTCSRGFTAFFSAS